MKVGHVSVVGCCVEGSFLQSLLEVIPYILSFIWGALMEVFGSFQVLQI